MSKYYLGVKGEPGDRTVMRRTRGLMRGREEERGEGYMERKNRWGST